MLTTSAFVSIARVGPIKPGTGRLMPKSKRFMLTKAPTSRSTRITRMVKAIALWIGFTSACIRLKRSTRPAWVRSQPAGDIRTE